MDELSLISLYSGSKGNSTLIRFGADAVLIDAGRSLRALSTALVSVGESLENVRAIFITHEHSDHVSALEMLSKKYRIPIYMTADSAEKYLPTAFYAKNNLHQKPPYFTETVGKMTVSSFPTPHDSEMSVGYTITLPDGRKIGYATDIGQITDEIRAGLFGCFAAVVESNHDLTMLKNGPYPASLKARIRSPRGHLSNGECAAFLTELAASGTRDVLLAHLSAENNTPQCAYAAAKAACGGLHIEVAREAEPVRLI